jgi:hypothetical protein
MMEYGATSLRTRLPVAITDCLPTFAALIAPSPTQQSSRSESPDMSRLDERDHPAIGLECTVAIEDAGFEDVTSC